jgi:catechol 2,3-dioxygenase-like lactoylglutathione lyase family enzyme
MAQEEVLEMTATGTAALTKLTPVLVVEAIEPCLPFWVDRLGFKAVAEVQHGELLGFVILVGDGVELMIQTRASLADDLPAAVGVPGHAILYCEGPDLDAIAARLDGAAEVIVARRTTSYGSDEIWVREPGGNVVGFSKPSADAG